jgi:arylsulfatase
MAGVSYPDAFNGHKLTPVEGRSLLPLFQGKDRPGHEALFFEHVGGRAVRMGDWKLVAYSRTPEQWELYNLVEDQTETRNVAREHPDRVRAMASAWRAWAERVGARIE